jgi:hypothetical protein
MHVIQPDPRPRESGEYEFRATKGYGDPRGYIMLDEERLLELRDVRVEDCDRLIKAAAGLKDRILALTAEMTAPHGRNHFYQGTCQLCGKPEADGLHADPEPTPYDRAIEQAEAFAQPGNTVADILAESIAAGAVMHADAAGSE